MFTGLVSDVGEILSVEARGDLRRLRIACSYDPASIALGASIACSGVCMTAVDFGNDGMRNWFDVDAAAETLAKTTVGLWTPGRLVNLERSLKIGDELGGHLVSGHVDGVARILERRDFDGMAHFDIEAPHDLAKFIAAKGSVALDGTSLTVNEADGDRFTILLIPHTIAVTSWRERGTNDPVNIEVDQMARYAARLMEAR
ncbi:MAG: riboflavin synthase [Rhodoblastus sp.]